MGITSTENRYVIISCQPSSHLIPLVRLTAIITLYKIKVLCIQPMLDHSQPSRTAKAHELFSKRMCRTYYPTTLMHKPYYSDKCHSSMLKQFINFLRRIRWQYYKKMSIVKCIVFYSSQDNKILNFFLLTQVCPEAII